MPKKKKNTARATRRNASARTIQRDFADAKAANENVATPQAEAKDRVQGQNRVALWDALAKNQWHRRCKLLPGLRLRYPTDDEQRHIARLAKVDHPFHATINGIILDAHLADATYRTLSIPQVKVALNNVGNQAIQLAELLSALDIGRGSRGSLQRAGVLIEAELFLEQMKARPILLPKYIDLLDGLSSAARRAAQKPMHPPKGAGGNPAFDRFIEDLLMAARSRGGTWTNYRPDGKEWKGTLLEALEVLKKYLPARFFPPGELGRSVEHIRKKLKDHIKKAPARRLMPQ
jgi:hypothetical protein